LRIRAPERHTEVAYRSRVSEQNSASEMTYIVSSGALNSTHSLTSEQNVQMGIEFQIGEQRFVVIVV